MKAFVESILACIKDSYIYINPQFKVVHYNESAKTLIQQYTKRELKKRRFICDYLDDAMCSEFNNSLSQWFKSKKSDQHEFKLGLDIRGIEWNMRVICDKSDNVLGYLVMPKQVVESKVQEDVTDIDQFAFYLSHHLRAPVATILGLSDLINMGVKDQDLNFALNSIELSAKRLDMVISELNNWLRCPDQRRLRAS